MRRRVVSVLLLLLLVGAGALAWTLLGWPPPRLVLKYGIPPYCEPTGHTRTVEGIEFVQIGSGCFRMGSDHMAEGGDFLGKLCAMFGLPWGEQPKPSDEMPVHWVEFENGFWIAKCEITNEQYERFAPGHRRFDWSSGARHPVVNVSWEDARSYCAWLAEKEGIPIRLPTEAEWECACRAGNASEYCFGDDAERLGEYAWFDANAEGGAHEVGTRRANDWGLNDFHGNVGEWCEDSYNSGYEGAPAEGSARLGEGNQLRVWRGGVWGYSAVYCRSANRSADTPSGLGYIPGFRPAFTLPEEE